MEKCTLFLVKDGVVEEKDMQSVIQTVLNRYGKPTVSLVELIYRTLFELKKKAAKTEDIKLDWEEWESFIKSEFGNSDSYIQNELYGIIAALKIFNTPIPIELFCRYFELKERKLKSHLNERLMSYHIEPVIFHNDTLQPKHDVIAELFFLFHEKTSINSLMQNLIQYMNAKEIELLLANMVNKREFKRGKKYYVGEIKYRDYMNEIYNCVEKHNLCLSNTGMANLCLGFLWSRFQKSTYENNVLLNEILNQFAPEIDETPVVAILYTEWGIWKQDSGDNTLAEEKYRIVINHYPKQLPARTELGKLLSKQKGREKEAEEVLREVIRIDSKNLHARTVLAKLYEDCNRQREAIVLYQEVCKYDSGNPYGEQGLKRLKKYINE